MRGRQSHGASGALSVGSALSLALVVAGCWSRGSASHGTTGASGGEGGSGVGASTSVTSSGASSSGAGGMLVGPRALPDTSAVTALLVGRLPAALSQAQLEFVAKHYVGSRKLLKVTSNAIRVHRPAFVVLHEHLAMWQATEDLEFILDGATWGSDYAAVQSHEPWFWHELGGKRVQSKADGKWLMDVSSTDFVGYWSDSVVQQATLGDDDGVVATAGSPLSVSQEGLKPADPRLSGTGVVVNTLPQLAGLTFVEAWEKWVTLVTSELAAKSLPLFVEVGSLTEPWDTTNDAVASGVVIDITASATLSVSPWLSWMNRVLALTEGHNVILKGRLDSESNVPLRRYLLGIYLLTKGGHTYLDCQHSSALEWYPEWGVELGAPLESAASIDKLVGVSGLFVRHFEKGVIYVNPTDGLVPVPLTVPMRRVRPLGGGTVFAMGKEPGALGYEPLDVVQVEAHSAELLIPLEGAPAP